MARGRWRKEKFHGYIAIFIAIIYLSCISLLPWGGGGGGGTEAPMLPPPLDPALTIPNDHESGVKRSPHLVSTTVQEASAMFGAVLCHMRHAHR